MLGAVALASLAVVALAGGSCSGPVGRAEVLRREKLGEPLERLKGIARPLGDPAPGDWLRSHPERGQTLEEFMAMRSVPLLAHHDTIDVVPIGAFTRAQWHVIESTADYLERFYGSPIRLLATVPLSAIPDSAVRFREDLGWSQLSTHYVLVRLLPGHRDPSAYATIALTSVDLYPQPSWNFVFGQASPANCSGVWSMFRFGDPGESTAAERACLLRTIKTASHEIGHMLPIHHCIAYECVMNGSNNLGELDRRPTDLCPHCLSKLMRCTRTDPVRRAQRLLEFHAAHGFRKEEAANRRTLSLLERRPRTK